MTTPVPTVNRELASEHGHHPDITDSGTHGIVRCGRHRVPARTLPRNHDSRTCVRGAAGETEAESYRGELTAYCYRFFASYAEAEDAVQGAFLQAWSRGSGFEGQSSLRR
ncbi:sigma factor [Corynebacterium variabile]|uniref:sigma factor n=1 Tax=Corynebacterium variabile TaxID=1727 RepID=UPI003F9E5C10